MTKRDWVSIALYAVAMAFLLAGFALGSEACVTVAVGLVIGAVLMPLLGGHVTNVYIGVPSENREVDEGEES